MSPLDALRAEEAHAFARWCAFGRIYNALALALSEACPLDPRLCRDLQEVRRDLIVTVEAAHSVWAASALVRDQWATRLAEAERHAQAEAAAE